jgi:hypothetical protein
MQQTLVFHWRESATPMSKTGMLLTIAFGLAALLFVVWLVPFAWDTGSTGDSLSIVRKLERAPVQLFQLLLYPVAGVVFLAVAFVVRPRMRLRLDVLTLRYCSGVPFLSKWLDWTLDLDSIRSGAVVLRLVSAAPVASGLGGELAMRTYAVTWMAQGSKSPIARMLRPCQWYLPDQPAVRPKFLAGAAFWGNSERAAAALEKQAQALPLMQALAQRGIVLPAITGKPASMGIDLMADARMKSLVYWFFSLLLFAVILTLWVRNTYYFVSPPIAVWLASGGVAAACALGWIWHGPDAATVDRAADTRGAQTADLRATQAILAVLVGVAAGLCAPSLPLALADLLQPAHDEVFLVRKSPLELAPLLPVQGIPPIQQLKAEDYWLSLPNGEAVTLPIRRGAWGLWWQFDASTVREKWIAYYSEHP